MALSKMQQNLKSTIEGEGEISVLPKNLSRLRNEVFRSGEYTFGFTSLPNSLTYIGESAFSGCSELTLTSLPENVTHIGDYAFSYCENVRFDLPNKIKYYGNWVFGYNQDAHFEITEIPRSLNEEIGVGAFQGIKTLVSANIPEGIREVSDNVFHGCTNLVNVTFPSSIIWYVGGAISDCPKLTSLVFPANMTTFGGYISFYGCTSLKTITFQSTTGIAIQYPSSFLSSCPSITDIYVGWGEEDKCGEPWGATNATVHYNCMATENA